MKFNSKEQGVTVSDEGKSQINNLISGVLIGYAITCLVIITYAILITYSSFTGQSLPLVVTITALISVIIAGFDAAKGAKSKGWLWGLIAGLCYSIILVSIGVWINKGFIIDTRSITLVILCIAGGGLGGVIGINFRK